MCGLINTRSPVLSTVLIKKSGFDEDDLDEVVLTECPKVREEWDESRLRFRKV